MFRKIRWELTITYILVIVFSMAILGVFLLNFIEDYFAKNARQELYRQAQLIAEGWPSSLSLKESSLVESRFYWNMIERISHQTGSRIRLLNERGMPIYDTGGKVEIDLSIRPEIKESLAGRTARGKVGGKYSQAYPIFEHNPSGSKSRVIGVVYVTRSRTYLQAILSYVKSQFYLGFIISLVLSVLLALLFSHYIAKPITEIAHQADLMARGNLDQRTVVNTKNEIGDLSEKFNLMAQKLKGTLDLLTSEKNKLAAIINNMAGGVLVIDYKWEIAMVNRTAFKLLGIRQKEILGKKISTVLPGHTLLQLLEDSGLEREVHGSLEDLPEDRAVDAHVTPLFSENNESVGAVVILNDVTEFRRLDRMRAEFVSNVSHELRTPLASIKGLAELLIDGALKEERADEFLNSINREVDRLTRLVKDLLDLSRMESGMVKMEIHPVNMSEAINQVVTRLTPQARKKNIEVITDLKCECLALANMDRLQQVLINLVDNAIRYTPPGEKIYTKLSCSSNRCLVEVQDTGPGITSKDLERVFERFYRADRARTRGVGGFGLGLAITKQIVENLGGEIGVQSKPGEGTNFYFTLPLAKLAE